MIPFHLISLGTLRRSRVPGILTFLALSVASPWPGSGASSLDEAMRVAKQRSAARVFSSAEIHQKPAIYSVELSPNGRQIAYLRREGKNSSLWFLDLETNQSNRRFASKRIQSLDWATDSSGVFIETHTQIAFLRHSGERPSFVVKLDPLGEQEYRGVDPTRSHQILVSEKTSEDRYELLRMDLDGNRQLIFQSERPLGSFLLGASGQLEFASRPDGFQLRILRYSPSAEPEELLRCEFGDPCQPIATTPDRKSLIVHTRNQGDLKGLYSIDLESRATQLIHSDPHELADLSDFTLDATTQELLAASYYSDQLRDYPIHPKLVSNYHKLLASFPDSTVRIESRVQGGFWIVVESGPKIHHPRYHLFETTSGELRSLFQKERAEGLPLDENLLAEQQFFTYKAGDGMTLHGLVTLPPGVDPTTAPMVVEVHGGPWNQVKPGFHGISQLLANRGYVVFTPNFRASTGYGHHYVMSAKGEFGDGRVHQDILDGMDFLAAHSIGDPKRVAMTGHSFGGFSTLSALAFSSERFVAGVASAPPIDLVRSLRQIHETKTVSHGFKQREVVERMLVDFEDPVAVDTLRSKSPELHLQNTDKPLLIMAGWKRPQSRRCAR